MEQKRIIWIAVAVGIFLTAVIVAALAIFTPGKQAEPAVASLTPPADTWARIPTPSEQISELNVRATTANVYSDSVTTITLTPPENDITMVGQTLQNQQQAQAPQQTQPAALQNAPQSEPAETVPAVTITPPKQTSTQTAPKPAAQTKPAIAAAAKPAAQSVAPKVTVTEYWIQAAAPTEKKFAEQARERLAQNKITSDIFTVEKDGKMFYRVRVGPYKTKTEAEYWLGLVKEDPAFNASYITEVKAQR